MKLIPAIDLKNNKVVIPDSNNRSDYQEISIDKSPSSDPIQFIRYLLSIGNFSTIYLADLDSIDDFKENNILLIEILNNYKHIHFIIDNGVRKLSQFEYIDNYNFTQVIATETFEDYKKLYKISSNNYILSLDIKNKKILSKTDEYLYLKPKKTICMNLDNVGRRKGLNLENIEQCKKIFPKSKIIYSGGVRNQEDLDNLSAMMIDEVILLTYLLNKGVTQNQL